ncbi:MAG TPA: sulfite exporter TauE/SafE family protein [Bacteroidia bacterium]|nr:sulfite exporter TauE/SafE family protein [Bacteroidia bacterium]
MQPARFFSPFLLILTAAWLIIYLFIFPDPAGLFLENWPIILLAVAAAIVGNMTAIGGGIIFIPVFMFIYHVNPVSALKLTFVTQAVGMTSGATGWVQRKTVPLKLLKWTIPSLILGSVVSTFFIHPQTMLIKSMFGPVSFFVGMLTLVLAGRKSSGDDLPPKAMLPVFLVSFIGGLITGWVAIGEGEIIAAFCMLVYGLDTNKSVGLGVVLLSVNSILLALVHALYFGGVPWDLAMFTIPGVIWGGRLGPFLAKRTSATVMKRIFGWIAMLDGLLITLQVVRGHLLR